MKKRYLFIGCLAILMVSCAGLIGELIENLTTVDAKYTKLVDGGIQIKDFKRNIKLEQFGITDENGKDFDSLSFDEPKDGVMSCREVPVDFVKIDDQPGKRAVTPSTLIGTWETIVPMTEGFRRTFLDFKNNGECSMYLEIFPKKDVQIVTRVETVLKGFLKNTKDGYELNVNDKQVKGYAKAIERFSAQLLKNEDGTLTAKFEIEKGKPTKVKLFELSKDDSTLYVGTGDFSSAITFKIAKNNSFTLTIPKGLVLPKKF